MIVVHPDAGREIADGVDYYDRQRAGLGDEFADEVQAAMALVDRNPFAYQVIRGGVRRCLVRRFPYAVIFVERPTYVLVVAVMHVRRQPNYWAERL